jgi:hypothetical protein
LPKVFNICTREDFEVFKNLVESGEMPFVCQHCQDQSTCPGPQCQKRWKNRSTKVQAGDCDVHEAVILKSGNEFSDLEDNIQSPVHSSQPVSIPLPKIETFEDIFPPSALDKKKPGISYSFSESISHNLNEMPRLTRPASWDSGKGMQALSDKSQMLSMTGLPHINQLLVSKSAEFGPESKRKSSLDNIFDFESSNFFQQPAQFDDRSKRLRLEQSADEFGPQQAKYERFNVPSKLKVESEANQTHKAIKAGNWNITKGSNISGFDFDGLSIEDDVHFTDFSESPFYSRSRLTAPCASSAPLPETFTRTPFSKNVKVMLSENSGRTEEDLESVHSLHDIVLSRDPISDVILSDIDPPQSSLFFSTSD